MSDVTVYKGEEGNVVRQTVYTTSAETAVLDVTGASVRLTVGNKQLGKNYLGPIDGTVANGPAGLVQAPITLAQLATLPTGEYDADFHVTESDGDSRVTKQFSLHVDERVPTT